MLLFLWGELLLDRSRQPVLTSGAPVLDPLLAGFCQGNERFSPVVRVGGSRNKPHLFQRKDNRAHRLRTHPLCPGKARHRRRTVLFQSQNHCDLRRGEIVLFTLLSNLPLEISECSTQLCCQRGCKCCVLVQCRSGHTKRVTYSTVFCKVYLLNCSCVIVVGPARGGDQRGGARRFAGDRQRGAAEGHARRPDSSHAASRYGSTERARER